ncbi:MAG: Methylated-DNA-[protein]-cysteine S-methyltransferase DNA binding protein [uncultured bacterium (gcode 4)]|uniref:Methylated-DNA-[protein]-cysteine S-methyltransferase DNA binding protein n=1 Tax=uncultured bacterium (gcode 4) TaxID=1234023 RepID=K2AF73_9BACT|nr:MAG: Methylated-DNA-[protein]-cysteine S-methyltransferase DNA binding protein [uncultured bacterium (gcode 4)]
MNQKIYDFLQKIPVWKVVSYKIIGGKFGIHPRQVARILSENKDTEIYPCYKVVNNNWKLGGYNLWVWEKIRKLEKDGIKIINNWISKKYFWE